MCVYALQFIIKSSRWAGGRTRHPQQRRAFISPHPTPRVHAAHARAAPQHKMAIYLYPHRMRHAEPSSVDVVRRKISRAYIFLRVKFCTAFERWRWQKRGGGEKARGMDIEIGRRWSVRIQQIHTHTQEYTSIWYVHTIMVASASAAFPIYSCHSCCVRRGTYNIAIYTRSHSTRIPHVHIYTRREPCLRYSNTNW